MAVAGMLRNLLCLIGVSVAVASGASGGSGRQAEDRAGARGVGGSSVQVAAAVGPSAWRLSIRVGQLCCRTVSAGL